MEFKQSDFSFNGLKGVIFDLDETLINSLEVYTEAFNQGISAFKLRPVNKREIACLLDQGKRLAEILSILFPDTFSDENQRGICQERIRRWYLDFGILKVELKPGVRQILHSIKDMGFKIGIVTGRMTRSDNKWAELKQLGIVEYIDIMVTAAEAPPKPDAGGLLECIQDLGLSPSECIFIGDSRIDVIAGKNAGLKTIAVHSGVSDKDSLAELKPDRVVEDLGTILFYLTESYKYEKF